jgi:hypothetical protein
MSNIQNKEIIEQAGLRNGFMPEAMERLSRIAIWNAGVSMALILALAGAYIFQPGPQSYAVTPDGRITKLIPLSEGVGTEGLIDFVGRAVIASYSIDFLNWEKQLGALAPLYTESGYNAFMQSVKPLKDRVVDGGYITAVGLASPPLIVKSAVMDGVMKYRVKMNVIIGFEGQTKRISPQTWQVDVIVDRIPTNKSPVGIAISSIVAKPL